MMKLNRHATAVAMCRVNFFVPRCKMNSYSVSALGIDKWMIYGLYDDRCSPVGASGALVECARVSAIDSGTEPVRSSPERTIERASSARFVIF